MGLARSALKNSYSPYSNFKVGAVLVTTDGKTFTGTNVENASYSLTICAERAALFAAVSSGHSIFSDLFISSSSKEPAFPCGACRQVLMEFSPNLRIHLEGNDDKIYYLKDLQPHSFSRAQIKNNE